MSEDLVRGAQQGDQHAFESLMLTHHARLFRVAHGILRDPHLADDAVQVAFIDVWRHIRRLHDPSRFDGWSYRILVNACRDEANRRLRWLAASDMQTAEEPLLGDVANAVMDRDLVDRGFRYLSVDHRAVLVLRYLLGMTPEQVAEVLGIPRRTVYSRLKRAVPAMRAALEADSRRVRSPSKREALL
jgi:RNA polymerase sigma-70 factor (ECF subfamily)